MTEMDGIVTGTLLVTPNALMFDPDAAHPLVIENGQDLYIMMARLVYIMRLLILTTGIFAYILLILLVLNVKLLGLKLVSVIFKFYGYIKLCSL